MHQVTTTFTSAFQFTFWFIQVGTHTSISPLCFLSTSSISQIPPHPPLPKPTNSLRWSVPSLPSRTTLTTWSDSRWQWATAQTLRCQLRFKMPCRQGPTRLTPQTCLWTKHLMREGLPWPLSPLPTSSTSSFSFSRRSACVYIEDHHVNMNGNINL